MAGTLSTVVSRYASLAPSNQCRSSSRITRSPRYAGSWRIRFRTPWMRFCRCSGSIAGDGFAASGTPNKSKTNGSTSRKLSSISKRRPAIFARVASGPSPSVIS